MPPHAVNHYERLKVTQDAPPEVIRAAYRALANRLPAGSAAPGEAFDAAQEEMMGLNAAYETLIDPMLRRDYDASLSATVSWHTATPSTPADAGADLSVELLPPELVAPVSAWAPDVKRVLLGGALLLLLTALGLAWFLNGSPPAPSIDVTQGGQLGSVGDSIATEAVRRGEVSALTQGAVGAVRRPTVEELARMTDEELLAAMPALDGSAPPSSRRGQVLAQATSARHPLDGPGLRLRSDLELLGSHAVAPAPDNRP
jgi:hypothetical protein